jgi:voltage-gated potassium channel Kch
VPPVPPVADHRDHLIVCGEDSLACRVAEELTTRYGQSVTVLLKSSRGSRIAALPHVRVVERAELDGDAFGAAGVGSARALALLGQDDLGNFHAALGEPAPSHVRVAGRTLYVVRSSAIDPRHVICGLATTDDDPLSPALLPTDTGNADLVLAVADGAPRDPLTRQRRRPVRAVTNLLRRYLWHKLGFAFLALFALLVAGFILLITLAHHTLGNSVYLTFMDAAGAAFTSPKDHTPEKVAQVMLTFAGLAFIPVATAAVVSARLTGSLEDPDRPMSNHVIVAGLGNVGTRIVGQLHDLGVGVVCVDKSETAAGIPLARRLGLRVVIGETHLEETLRAAGIGTC